MDHATKGFFQDILHHPSPIRRKKSDHQTPSGDGLWLGLPHPQLWQTFTQLWKDPPFSMGKSTISMAIFNSKLLVYQRVSATIVGRRFNDKLANIVSFSSSEAGKKTVP